MCTLDIVHKVAIGQNCRDLNDMIKEVKYFIDSRNFYFKDYTCTFVSEVIIAPGVSDDV